MNPAETWTKESWRAFPIKQQPNWPDPIALAKTSKQLADLPALVFAGETRTLFSELKKVGNGEAFLLQCGDCAEDFSSCNGPRIHDLLRVILQMSIILAHSGQKPIVKVGRIAGQYAKPRSSDFEVINGQRIPSYRGDMVNGSSPRLSERNPNPERILEGYFRATATLNLIRAFTRGGYGSLDKIKDWQAHSFSTNPVMEKYNTLVNEINEAINSHKSTGITTDLSVVHGDLLYTSHEALLLDYEEPMTRIDTTTGKWYDTSAHMLWLGDRTRHPDEAHVEFLRGTCNPLGVKVGPSYKIDELKRTIEALNTDNELGRITIIPRFGKDRISEYLQPLLQSLKAEGFNLVWCCDPMHGNTVKSDSHKTRLFEDILSEVKSFWQILKAENINPGGVHLEVTGDNVTECIGGISGVTESGIGLNYTTNCDPRLNAAQAVELAFEVGKIISS